MAKNLCSTKKLNIPPHYTHTAQHRIQHYCVNQPLLPTLKRKRETPQIKKADNSKALGVVCIFSPPHPHKETKKQHATKNMLRHASRKVIISNKFTRTLENIIVPLAFIIGTAGSGKSLFTAAFAEWLKNEQARCCGRQLGSWRIKTALSTRR